jgi:hypothetical protein
MLVMALARSGAAVLMPVSGPFAGIVAEDGLVYARRRNS